jgi:hypothetical protein
MTSSLEQLDNYNAFISKDFSRRHRVHKEHRGNIGNKVYDITEY